MVAVEHLTRVHGLELLFRALLPRHGDQPVQVGPDHRGLAGLLAHPLEPAELLGGLLFDVLGHAGFGDLGAVLVDDRRGVLAQLTLDRLHLLAQEVLALLLVGALADVLADLQAELELGQPLALDAHGRLQALADVERLEHFHLLVERHVRGVADRVGQRARLADRAQPRADAVVDAAQLEDLLDHGAVLALEVACATVDGNVVVVLGHLDTEAAEVVGVGRAGDAAGHSGKGDRSASAGQADVVGHLGDGADLGKCRLVAGDEENLLLVADVDG